MKTALTSVLALALIATAHGAALKKASFTRVINDVKIVPQQAQPKPASIGDIVEGMTTVTTGAQSRAELRFEDKTITRLGANSIFNIQDGTRNVDLKQGVLLLQVPKQMGGARVHTAAVTAAVTGTTVMVAYMPDGYIKCIVLEGEMDMFPNDHPDAFRTLKAGDMIIMKPDGTFIPEPVQVDLAHLKKTSKLLDAKEFGELGNQKELQDAFGTQFSLKQKGDLAPTPLIMPGRDPILQILHDPDQSTPPGDIQSPNTPGTTPDTNTPPEVNPKFGRPGLLGGTAVLDDETTIVTDPKITTTFSGTVGTGNGKIFRPGVDGTGLGEAAFDEPSRAIPGDTGGPQFYPDRLLKSMGSIAAFRFANAYLVGSPQVTTTGGPTNLLLASDANFIISTDSPYYGGGLGTADFIGNSGAWDLNASGLKNLVIAARDNIVIQPGFAFSGSDQSLILYTQTNTPATEGGTASTIYGGGFLNGGGDIDIAAFGSAPAVSLPDGTFEAHAARDLTLSGGSIGASTYSTRNVDPSTTVAEAKDMNLTAGQDVTVNQGVKLQASNTMSITAQRNITIYDSAILKRLTNTDLNHISLVAQTGNVALLGSSPTSRNVKVQGYAVDIMAPAGNITLSYSDISAEYLRVQTLAPDGTLTIGNSNLTAFNSMKLYAEGSNGKVLFNGNTNLYGPAIIAAKTVEIVNGVTVNVSSPNGFNVHSDVERFNSSGYGNFSNGGLPLTFVGTGSTGPHKGSFSSRPGF